jgi:hypothetical protein
MNKKLVRIIALVLAGLMALSIVTGALIILIR